MSENSVLFKKAIEKWGISHQSFVCIEEMAELTKELSKDFRGGGDLFRIAEEIADVEIMLSQIKLYYGVRTEVERVRSKKLERLRGLIDGQY